jgi:phosphoserine phosphatase RsbU/P
VIYSDGLSEARPELFRDQNTVAAQITADETASATAQRLVELATSNGPLPDDLTVVVLRRSPEVTTESAAA